MPDLHIGTLGIVGGGLIGSSIMRAARARGAAKRIVAIDADADVRERLEELALADAVRAPGADAGAQIDHLILAVPLGAMARAVETLAPSLSAETVVSDVGSSKRSVMADMARVLPHPARFVPAHPIAGTEQSGPDAGFAELFAGRWCLLTPGPETDPEALAQTRHFWEALGAKVEEMDAGHHDVVLATTSHLPHLIAYSIVGTAAELEDITRSEVIKFSAGGFRDFTRLAASDPVMWRDVCLNNRDAVLQMLEKFSADLDALEASVRAGDGPALLDLFTRTRAVRRSIIDAGQEVAAPDFGRRASTVEQELADTQESSAPTEKNAHREVDAPARAASPLAE
ncbi:MAG: prephenate/arogenate dehydrogenase family protein [Pseudomonadota bacterium]